MVVFALAYLTQPRQFRSRDAEFFLRLPSRRLCGSLVGIECSTDGAVQASVTQGWTTLPQQEPLGAVLINMAGQHACGTVRAPETLTVRTFNSTVSGSA